MSFKCYTCWTAERVDIVMETEALQPSPALFAATHQPLRMYRQRQWHATDEPYDEQTFLKDFLEPASYIFVPVLGDAGTGKSHLIRWLHANIPATEKRRVLLIPKIGTNMRDVLLRILEMPGLEGEKFKGFRDRVRASSSHLTVEMAKELLLDNLATVIGPNGPHGGRGATKTLIDHLPALLRDSFFRPHLLIKGGVIDGLVGQAIGNISTAEPRDRRRQFTADDLPLKLAHARAASQSARDIWQKLCLTPQLSDEAVKWLNHWTNEAVARVFNLGGQDLEHIMLDVREELRKKDIELVILIEDFALLQGIDMQLLEALLTRPNLPDRQLCTLRVAMACTSGYFAPLFDTVQTRAAFYVNMDVKVTSGLVQENDALGLAARYLNAGRLDEKMLVDWHNGNQADANDGESAAAPPPSACHHCAHRAACHAAFGEVDGFGLYPFNSSAIVEMMRRTTGDKFNPRALIRRVLHETLQRYTKDLTEGKFPSKTLHVAFGNVYREAFGPDVQQDIRRLDPSNWVRRSVLLDLWSTATQAVNLDPGVHEAFDLRQINVRNVELLPPRPRPPIDGETQPAPPPPSNELPEVAANLLKAINDWSTGARKLIRGEYDVFRELVFEAVRDRIDWDAELLVRGKFAGAGATLPFQPRRSINFDGMQGQQGQAPVQLNLPLPGEDRLEVAVVLRAMVMRKYVGHWRYTGGAKDLRRCAFAVDRWSQHILSQLRRPLRDEPSFDPIPAAVEVLALGQRLLGRPTGANAPRAAQLDALFKPPGDPDPAPRAKQWVELVSLFREKFEAVKELVLSRAACTKGGSAVVQFADIAQLLTPLATVRKSWIPSQRIPDALAVPGSPFKPLADLRRKFDELLGVAITAERDRHAEWLAEMQRHLGDNFDLKAANDAAVAAARTAADVAVLLGPSADQLMQLRSEVPYAKFGETVDLVTSIVNGSADDRGPLLASLSKPLHGVMGIVARLVNEMDEMLNKSTEKVHTKLQEAEGNATDLDKTFRDIQGHFSRIANMLAELEGSNP